MSAFTVSKVRGWVGAGMAEAGGRLAVLSVTTAVMARLLEPGDFGVSALILSVITIFNVFVGTPYEEALAQKRVLRRIHLEAALGASSVSALAFMLLAVPVGWLLDLQYARHDMVVLLPVAASLLLAQGPLTVATAVARRRRKFYALNVASLAGNVAAAVFAVVLAVSGAGIWSLIGLRVGVVVANAAILLVLLRLTIRPRWSWATIRELNSYALFILLTRLVENSTLLIFNMAVGSLFGITVLGYANMAMRLIEPARGAIVAVTHNLSFAFFMGVVTDRARIAEGACRISAESTALIAPIFMGLAAISPVVVPLLAGPGWESVVPIVVMLALGAMVALPSQVVLSALSAIGRPDQAVYANVIGLLAMVAVLAATVGMDPVYVGLARAVGDLVQTLITIVLSGRLVALERGIFMRQVASSWVAAVVMAAAVGLLEAGLAPALPALAVLGLAVAGGVVVYGAVLYLLARSSFSRLLGMVAARTGAPAQGIADAA